MKKLLILAALVGTASCYDPAEFVYPIDTRSLVFQVPHDCDGERLLEDEDYTCMGIHPDISVLTDSNNPFAGGSSPFGQDVPDEGNGWRETPPDWLCQPSTHWKIDAEGGPVAGFYGWATLLAQGSKTSLGNPDVKPPGERQFYAAVNLREIQEEALFAPAAASGTLLNMTIRAFQSVLVHFPDAVAYNASGAVAYDLATPAYQALAELGGRIPEGWAMVALPNDGQRAIRVTPQEDE
jgi:hypothetical protein